MIPLIGILKGSAMNIFHSKVRKPRRAEMGYSASLQMIGETYHECMGDSCKNKKWISLAFPSS